VAFFHTLGDDGLGEITNGKMASYSIFFEAPDSSALEENIENIGGVFAGETPFTKTDIGKEQVFKAGFHPFKFRGISCVIVKWGEKGYERQYLKIEIVPGEIYCYVRIREDKCDYLEIVQ